MSSSKDNFTLIDGWIDKESIFNKIKKGDGVYTDCKAMSGDGTLYKVDCPPPSYAELQCYLQNQTKPLPDTICRNEAYYHICRKKK